MQIVTFYSVISYSIMSYDTTLYDIPSHKGTLQASDDPDGMSGCRASR